MMLIAMIASIVAAILVARGDALTPNIIWSISNIFIIWHNISICEWELTVLFVVYETIAVWGVWNLWGKERISQYNSKRRIEKIVNEYKEKED